MSNYRNACPPELFDDEDDDDYNKYFRPSENAPQSRNLSSNASDFPSDSGIKIIKSDIIGQKAGLNKSNFDIRLDTNAQQWFDKIHQYWRQCKCL